MSRVLNVKYKTTSHSINVNDFPDECGICHKNIDPIPVGANFVKGDVSSRNMEAAFQCTNLSCNSLIIGYYSREKYPGDFELVNVAPVNPAGKNFDKEIINLSNNFVTIYNQSFHAEQIGLTLISGIGFRKALEFLIKDYLIFLDESSEEMILNMQLGPCLNKLENNMIKEIAKRATWIGNDEAHYKRKWEDKDVNDLKKLIDITVHFISMDISAKKYLEEMAY
jgi:hypothetical protein